MVGLLPDDVNRDRSLIAGAAEKLLVRCHRRDARVVDFEIGRGPVVKE